MSIASHQQWVDLHMLSYNFKQLRMEKLNAGFCIICANRINWNVNRPFCVSCESKQKIIHRDFSHCHGCGCLSKDITIINPLCKEKCRPFDKSNTSSYIYLDRLDKYKQSKHIHTIWDYSPVLNVELIDKYEVCKLLKIIEFSGLKIYSVFDNNISTNKRIMNILWRWEFGLKVSPPILASDMKTFLDGRHRVLAAYYLNEDYIPIYRQK